MRIAIIDDGINPYLYSELANSPIEIQFVDIEGRITPKTVDEAIDPKVPLIHGTTTAAIIAKYSEDAEFIGLKIFHDQSMTANIKQLLAALNWCYKQKTPLVHMSIGSRAWVDYAPIRAIVAKMLKQRQVIVAAHSNIGEYTVPACIAGVYGVIADSSMQDNEYDITPIAANSRHIRASSAHSLSLPDGRVITTAISNSYAAPVITAKLHEHLTAHEPFSLPFVNYAKPDYLSTAYIVNPHKKEILSEHFFFKCLGEVSSMEEIEDREDDVINLPQGEITNSTGEPIWSEDNRQRLFEAYEYRGSRQECYVVNIYGNGIGALDFLCKLKKHFISEEYYCVGISDYAYSYLYGIEHIPSTTDKEIAIDYVHYLYNPDLIICFMENEKPPMLDDGKETDGYCVVLKEDTAFTQEDVVRAFRGIVEFWA